MAMLRRSQQDVLGEKKIGCERFEKSGSIWAGILLHHSSAKTEVLHYRRPAKSDAVDELSSRLCFSERNSNMLSDNNLVFTLNSFVTTKF